MTEECYQPGFVRIFLLMYYFFPLMFIFPTWIVAKFIYEPMLNRRELDNKQWLEYLKEEEKKIPYHLKYKLTADISNSNTKLTDFISEETPEGMVIMRYNVDEEGFEYWADKTISYINLETVALKYVNAFNCGGIYIDRMKLLKEKLEKISKTIEENKEREEEEEDDFDDWDDDKEQNDEKYWFTKDKIDTITNIHNYLDSLPQIGKVLSFSSVIEVATQLNNNKPLGTLEMGVLYSKIPESIKTEIIDPYISIEKNEARISLRIIDSQENLRRNDLINKINYDLENKLGLDKDRYKLAGVLILFNNLLQSLFKSQILTLGLVIIGIFAMFVVLFKNIKLSLIGVVPNFIAAFFILGVIGMLGIPLDMMTITIAAITIGIAVDNSIHYIYRFKEEFNNIKDYQKTLKTCHSTVGVAILNTSITIVFGFSILVLSKFIPTIYFGVFTGLAMLLAMLLVLTLLPSLILVVKPFGK